MKNLLDNLDVSGGGFFDNLKDTLKDTLQRTGLNFSVSNLIDAFFTKRGGGSKNLQDFAVQKEIMNKVIGGVMKTARNNQ